MGLLIVDGQTNFRASLAEVARKIWTVQALKAGFELPPLSEVSDAAPLRASINHNRLIVECPDCRGAEMVWRDGPHLMLCHGCWNAMAGHKWRRVSLPKNLGEIEGILLRRPMPQTRNWSHPETVGDLANENLEHAHELAGAEPAPTEPKRRSGTRPTRNRPAAEA